jgi:hypothetical protein
MNRAYYSDTIAAFLSKEPDAVLGELVRSASMTGARIETTQTDAWLEQILILKGALTPYRDEGSLYFEFSIPRLGKRIDVLAPIGAVLFVIEFKDGEDEFTSFALDQVCDYALDLKTFHETSHAVPIAPILIPTRAEGVVTSIAYGIPTGLDIGSSVHDSDYYLLARAAVRKIGARSMCRANV